VTAKLQEKRTPPMQYATILCRNIATDAALRPGNPKCAGRRKRLGAHEWGLALNSQIGKSVRGCENPDLRGIAAWRRRLLRAVSLGGLYALGGTLAGAPSWPLWPGPVRYVQGATLKAADVSLRHVLTPRLPVPSVGIWL
jgi:hypothetical protein